MRSPISHLLDGANVVFVASGVVIAKVLMNEPGVTGIYCDEKGHPMLGSALVRDAKFQDRVVAETRASLRRY
jgi:hypothetical protein